MATLVVPPQVRVGQGEPQGLGLRDRIEFAELDPDVVFVGEIRDQETARIAMQAGMTGHLLITTVHAGSTAAAFSRLLEMGVATYSLNAAVTAVIAQRLVRQICPHCRKERGLTEHDLGDLGIKVPPPGLRVFYGTGCDACRGSGYLGRVLLFELAVMTPPLREAVLRKGSIDDLKTAASRAGMETLLLDGLRKAACGRTTLSEVLRVVDASE